MGSRRGFGQFLLLLGILLALLFVVGVIGTVEAVSDQNVDVSFEKYVAATGTVAPYAVGAAVCWVGSAFFLARDSVPRQE